MKRISELTVMLFAAALLTGCSSETTHEIGKPDPDNGSNGERREVMLTLKNELVLKKADTKAANAQAATKADDDIATPEENTIHSLDIYVFGSATEGGVYTFQERFAYRADDSALPAGATELDLTTVDAKGKETTGLLTLKKGLFVKLYCIANNTTLLDIDNNPVEETAFVPLTFSQPGTNGTTVKEEGQPNENAFQTYHTPLLDSNTAADILTTPLAMSGSYTTPLDLTDFENSARLQIGFKLTRLAARFDIINNAAESRFTIESISMGNGRRGAGFFPIRAYESTPDELITYPARTFEGVNANVSNKAQTGAFYTYPSKKDDKGFLILKGKYKVNETESTDVSYQVPFTQQTADGSSSWLEIANNHRYTIAITKADDYHLDFTLEVADWTDSGEIDDYDPNKDGKLNFDVSIPAGSTTQYDGTNQTVSLSLIPGSYFDMEINTNAALTLSKSYAGGSEYQQYDWLEIETTPSIRMKADFQQTYEYKVSLKEGYDKGHYPRAILRFQNVVNGNESVFFVQSLSAPQITGAIISGEGNYHKADIPNNTISMYRTTENKLQLKVYCADEIELVSVPDWLTVEKAYSNVREVVYDIKVNNADAVVTDDRDSFTFRNKVHTDLKTAVTVNLLSTEITANDQNIVAANSGNKNLKVNDSPEGCKAIIKEWGGNTVWCEIDNANVLKGAEQNFSVTQLDNKNTLMKPVTILLKNNIAGGKDKEITLTPTFSAPTLGRSSYTLENVINLNSTEYKLTVLASGGHKFLSTTNTNIAEISRNPDDTYTIKAKKQGSATIKFANASATTQLISEFTIHVSIDFQQQSVYKYDGIYIAPFSGARLPWTENVSYCSSHGWRLPSKTEADRWVTTPGRQAEWNKYGLTGGETYWSTSTKDGNSKVWIFTPHTWGVSSHPQGNLFWSRCVKNS